jgi:type II secretory pathway component PulF
MDYSLLLIFFKKKDEALKRGVSIIHSKRNKEKRFIEVEDEEEAKTPLSNMGASPYDIQTFEKVSANALHNKSG